MIISKLTIGMFSSREGSWKPSNLSNLSIDFDTIPFITILDHLSRCFRWYQNHFKSVFSIQVRLSQTTRGSSSKMMIFITKLRMNFAFFPLTGAPESWGCWLTLQEMSQLSLCSVFPHSWSSGKWSQSIEGQVSLLLYYDMVLQSFFLFIAFYTFPGYKIILKWKLTKTAMKKKTFQSHASIVKSSTSWPSIGWLHAGASPGVRTSALPL